MANYAETELSYEAGRPIEIYDIAYSGNSWHYTNDVEELMLNNALYVPIPIERGETEENGDAEKANMEIKISRDSTMADVFKVTPPSEPVTITIRQYHKGAQLINPDLQTAVVWKGRVINVAWEDDEMILTTESVFSSLLRIGVTRKYSRQCTHALYGTGCRLNRDNFKVVAVATTQQGTTITIPHGKAANWFAGGYITYRNNETGALERRSIKENSGTTVTVTAFPLGMIAGKTEVTMYAGCDHTHGTCKNKFNNIINYGGQPYIPILNPFGGSSIY